MERATWALWNDAWRSPVHWIVCLDSRPAIVSSRFANSVKHPGMTQESTLKALMNDLIRATVPGSGHEARVAMWCGLALKLPEFDIQISIVVDWGLTIVLDAERRRSYLRRACKTLRLFLFKFSSSSSGEFLPQYRSFAILATMPSFIRPLSTQLMSSSRAVSEPGMPMADHTYTSLSVLLPRTILLFCLGRRTSRSRLH